jgi:hypothetical protein
MGIKLVGQVRRGLGSRIRSSLRVNPSLDVVVKRSWRRKIIFVHTGKCAGETILNVFRKAYRKSADFYEYHCFNANLLIRELIDGLEKTEGQSISILVATRDPIARWISSFNWDLHNIFLSKSKALNWGYREFPDVMQLASKIADGDPKALIFGRKGHMGMGISWYLPLGLLDRLPADNTFVIRQEFLERDLVNTLAMLMKKDGFSRAPGHISTPRTKGDFKSLYAADSFKDISDLSVAQINGLKCYLSDDYRVNDILIERFARR